MQNAIYEKVKHERDTTHFLYVDEANKKNRFFSFAHELKIMNLTKETVEWTTEDDSETDLISQYWIKDMNATVDVVSVRVFDESKRDVHFDIDYAEHNFYSKSFSTEQAAKNPQRCIDRIAAAVKEKIIALGHDPNDYDFQLSRKVSIEQGTYRIQCEYWKVR